MALRTLLTQAFAVLETRFALYDVDRAGKLAFPQLLRRMALGGFRDTEKLTQLFKAVDVDHTEDLDFGEFLMLMFYAEPLNQIFRGAALQDVENAWRALESAFSRHDTDRNLKLDAAELRGFLQTHLPSFLSAPEVQTACPPGSEIRFSSFMVLLYSLLMPVGKYRHQLAAPAAQQAPQGKGEQSTAWQKLTKAFVALEHDFRLFDKVLHLR